MNASVESRANRERHNSLQWINRLPIELLSRIFLAGDALNHATELSEVRAVNDEAFDVTAFDFQEIAVQVCRHWRTVGLGLPKLWSYITTERYLPDPRTELFLSRAGPTTPLYLALNMAGEFMDGIEIYNSHSLAERAFKYLTFIVKNGGVTSRWKVLKVWCELPSAMIGVIDFIAGAALDNLITLLIDYNPQGLNMIDACISMALSQRNNQQTAMFDSPPPQLRNLQLGGIPTEFFFQTPAMPLVSNLTQLELGVTSTLPPLRGLCELLSRSTGLESLTLDMSLVTQVRLHIGRGSEVQIDLPHLRRFVLKEPKSANWAISVLTMVNAPGVEEFTLDLNHTMPPHPPGAVALFTTFGRQGGQLMKSWPTTKSNMENRGCIFPVLRQLTLGPFPDQAIILKQMITCFPNLTRLNWELEESCEQAILSLGDHPLPCPRLEHLRVHGVPNDELEEVVKNRALHGAPLKVVEVNSRDWHMITAETKQYLEDTLDRFDQYVDENESDNDSDEDWSDDDEDDSDGFSLDSSESDISN